MMLATMVDVFASAASTSGSLGSELGLTSTLSAATYDHLLIIVTGHGKSK